MSKAMTKPLFILHYNQPTWQNGGVVPGITWYVSHKPGDGGVCWGYTKDASKAIALSRYWFFKFRKTHGVQARMTQVSP